MAAIENLLIARLPRKSRLSLMKLCKPVQLTTAQILCEGGKAIRRVYFPVAGFISLVTLLVGKPVLEVGMVGREGMLGAQITLGVMREPLHAVVQGRARRGESAPPLSAGNSTATRQDCASSTTFKVTREFLAFMLGVRRVGITTAAAVLQRQGLIKYHRGDIKILNRLGLEKAACGCYARDRKIYAALRRRDKDGN